MLLADGSGLYVYTYDGRLACSPKYPNMRADLCNAQTIAMCNDTLAVRDRQDEKTVHLFDLTLGGKPLGASAFARQSFSFSLCYITVQCTGCICT